MLSLVAGIWLATVHLCTKYDYRDSRLYHYVLLVVTSLQPEPWIIIIQVHSTPETYSILHAWGLYNNRCHPFVITNPQKWLVVRGRYNRWTGLLDWTIRCLSMLSYSFTLLAKFRSSRCLDQLTVWATIYAWHSGMHCIISSPTYFRYERRICKNQWRCGQRDSVDIILWCWREKHSFTGNPPAQCTHPAVNLCIRILHWKKTGLLSLFVLPWL